MKFITCFHFYNSDEIIYINFHPIFEIIYLAVYCTGNKKDSIISKKNMIGFYAILLCTYTSQNPQASLSHFYCENQPLKATVLQVKKDSSPLWSYHLPDCLGLSMSIYPNFILILSKFHPGKITINFDQIQKKIRFFFFGIRILFFLIWNVFFFKFTTVF